MSTKIVQIKWHNLTGTLSSHFCIIVSTPNELKYINVIIITDIEAGIDHIILCGSSEINNKNHIFLLQCETLFFDRKWHIQVNATYDVVQCVHTNSSLLVCCTKSSFKQSLEANKLGRRENELKK